MPLKNRLQFSRTNALYWQLAMWLLCGCALALVVLIWLGGSTETEDANKSGRRLIVRIADGLIEGKTDIPATPAPEEEKPAEATPTATAQPAATQSAALSAVPAPSQASASETAAQNVVEEMLKSTGMKTATVPLAPIKDELTEKLSIGPLPMIAPDGTRPWRYYAKPYALKGSHPMIAIVITELGQAKSVTEAAIKLPENFTLSLSPYGAQVGAWATSARAVGHEIMVDLPLEPTNYPASDPGPYSLLAGKPMEENAAKLQWVMSRFQGYTGLSTSQNEAYTSDDERLRATLELLRVRGVMLFMPHDLVRKESKTILNESKIAYMIADVVLDEELNESGIGARLTALEKVATRRGYAVGYAHGTPLTLTELQKWAKTAEDRGYTLVPLTYLTNLKFKK